MVLVFFDYLSISMAFGVLYVRCAALHFNIAPDLVDLFYFSVTTMTTMGLGDITPASHTVLSNFWQLPKS